MSREVERYLKQQYRRVPVDQTEKILDGIQKFMELARQPGLSAHDVIHEGAMAIYRFFPFREISIGLKSPVDGRYRYQEILGHSTVATEALKKLSYSYEEFFSQRDYPAFWLSRYTEVALLEEQPFLESEKDTYNRPTQLSEARKSIDDFVEGDYIDVYMFGPKDEMIGWVEMSATKNGKMPTAYVIKQLEAFILIISHVYLLTMAGKNEGEGKER